MTTHHRLRLTMTTGVHSRRTALRGLGGAGMATALGMAVPDRSHASQADPITMIEPEAGSWKTWVLTSGDQLRPGAPPDERATHDELAELEALVVDRDAAVLDRIAYWDAGSPGYRWNEIAMHQAIATGTRLEAYRLMALLNAAIYDATIAAWDAKYAYNRARPADVDATWDTAIPTPHSPSYPDEHAATAGAAVAVLAYLYPDDAERFRSLAEEAAASRVQAGVAYPSDTAAGLALGQAVGKLFVEHAQGDGSDAVFDIAQMPSGFGIWSGNPGNQPMIGQRKPWVLASGDQFRPAQPPAPDSEERAAELAEVRGYVRNTSPFTELQFWAQDPAGRPAPDSAPFTSSQCVYYYAPLIHLLWQPELAQKLFEYRWDANAPRSARAYALVSIAGWDSTIACWNGKFHYWVARPIQFDSTITTIVPTYGHPDYPSGHGTGLAATAHVLSYLFPRDAQFFQSRAEEDAASRVWAGIHFRSAVEAGLQLGQDVGDAVIAWAKADGSN